MSDSGAWGASETQYFYELDPNSILGAVEQLGYKCTGRCLALNSMENRVYEVEIDVEGELGSASDAYRVIKFYRPGRWTKEQIQDEHDFLLDLKKAELPVIAPVQSDTGDTLFQLKDVGLYFAVFPKRGGRIPDEVTDDLASRLGSLLARMHNVGSEFDCDHRIELDTITYGEANLHYLLESDSLPGHIGQRYQKVVETICSRSAPLFDSVAYQRIHGDCHFGNVLIHPDEGVRLLDFDDMVWGPCIQDLWLLFPGQDSERERMWQIMLSSYQDFRVFDLESVKLIEPLRALRFVHFSAWIARRWQDPAFPNAFPAFGTDPYWEQQLFDLEEQLELIR